MSKSAHLRFQDHRAIWLLAHECRELGDDYRRWQLHFLAGLAGLASADVSVGAETGIIASQPRQLEGSSPADWGFENGFNKNGWLHTIELLATDPTYTCLLHYYFRSGSQDTGAPKRRTDLISTGDWQRSREYDAAYRMMGLDHSLCCFRFIPRANNVALGGFVCRAAKRSDFSVREVAVVEEAYATLAPMVGAALARFAEPSPSDLSRRVRQVLRCLLEGEGDKQIAARLSISKHTVNQYMKVIFQHFDVQSRPELLARWIRRGWGARFAWVDD